MSRHLFLQKPNKIGISKFGRITKTKTLTTKHVIFKILIISAAQGVGPKLAQRIILELKDKVSTKTSFAVDDNPVSSASAENEAVTALTALGYSFNDAVTAVSKAPKDLSVEDTIKFALKQFI